MTRCIIPIRLAFALAATTALSGFNGALGQQASDPAGEATSDVIVVIGSQIAGNPAAAALAVTVVGERELEAIAASSGDELLRAIPQLGDVGFNTSRTIGSVNDARGDTASINLRALGTGNTLVLLNGRRMVNHPGTQTENNVPVVTVNANAIPLSAIGRVEVLLDGASAIYGADAVAGVVNNVLKSDFEGFTAEALYGGESGVDAAEFQASFDLGLKFNDDRTRLAVFGSIFSRDPVFASERDFTANADHRSRLPAEWAGQSQFNNAATTSAWAGLDRRTTGSISVNGVLVTNAAGQFHIQPDTNAGCLASLGGGVCIDDTITRDDNLRYNVNEEATVSNGVDRFNLFGTFAQAIGANMEVFAEAGVYIAESEGYRESAPLLGAVPVVIPAANYYNPFGPTGSANRLAGTNAPAAGLDIILNGYRPVDAGPRQFTVENVVTRFLGGLRGDVAGFDWETAVTWSEANSDDRANRVSNTLFQQALARSTPDAYNPFNGGCTTDPANGDCTPSLAATIDDITVEVFRKSRTTLAMWDARVSKGDLFRIWAGDIGFAAGAEYREETFRDDRDPRQDGEINYVDPISLLATNDLQGNSPSLDVEGERTVTSGWLELAVPLVSEEMNIPLVQSVNLQLAGRYENFDTFGEVTKPKVALSWRLTDFLKVRSAWSEGFRAPNLQQQFEQGLQRSNNRTDLVFCEADRRAGRIASYTTTCPNRTQSVISDREGSLSLQPEESESLTAGVVFESSFLPSRFGRVTLTADWWSIEQTGVISAFGDANHIALDLALRVQGSFNPAVVRAAPTAADDLAFAGTGLTSVGQILFVDDNYTNLFPRQVEGVDLGFYYDLDDTPLGDFNLRINGAYLSKFFQESSPRGDEITAAQAAGLIPAQITVDGEADLVRQNGRPEWRWSSSLSWRKGGLGAGWFTSFVGDVEDPDIVRASDNAVWQIESYQTHNLYLQYTLGHDGDAPMRIRIGARNIFDEQPPLADTNFGYLGDLHSPAGRFVYGSVRKTF